MKNLKLFVFFQDGPFEKKIQKKKFSFLIDGLWEKSSLLYAGPKDDWLTNKRQGLAR